MTVKLVFISTTTTSHNASGRKPHPLLPSVPFGCCFYTLFFFLKKGPSLEERQPGKCPISEDVVVNIYVAISVRPQISFDGSYGKQLGRHATNTGVTSDLSLRACVCFELLLPVNCFLQ